jgi:DNA-directed RNA polymerase subunit RPC12/RpoP
MEYKCLKCKKDYSSYKSLWNHNKNKHKNDVANVLNIVTNFVTECNIYKCKKCFSTFNSRQTKWRHEKICDKEQIKIDENYKIIKMIDEIKQENKELKTIVNKLSKTTGNNSTININNIGNTNTVNNINSLGYENILSKLSEKDKIHLLTGFRHDEYPIIELVRKIYTNDDFKNERNTLLTNLQNKSCLIYKSDNNKFEATNKNKHIDNIIKNRKNDITTIYNQFNDTSKLKPKERKAIEDYLENIEQIDKKDKNLKALYEKHKEEIIYIIYNCKEFMGTIRDNLVNHDDSDDDNIDI